MFFAFKYLKERIILIIAISYFAGLLLAALLCDRSGCPAVLDISKTGIIICILLLAYCLLTKKRKYLKIMLAVVSLLAGCMWFSSYRHALEKDLSGMFDKKMSYRIRMQESSYKTGGESTSLPFERGRAVLEGCWGGQYSELHHNVIVSIPLHAQYGETLDVTGILRSPQRARNRGMYNERAVLFSKGIAAVLQASSVERRSMAEADPFFLWWNTKKERIILDLQKLLPIENASLISSFLLGYKNDLDGETKQDFSDSGLSHLMAVSGLHVGLILLISLMIGRIIGLRHKTRCIAGIISLLCYAVLIGFSASVIRATMIAVMVLMGKMINREEDTITSISFSALVLAILCPMTVFDLGFQMTFTACVGILILNHTILAFLQKFIDSRMVAGSISVSIAAQMATFPIVASAFHHLSLISALGTFYLTPVLGLMDFLGTFMIFFYECGQMLSAFTWFFSYLTNTILSLVRIFVSWCASLDFAYVNIPDRGGLMYFLYYFVIFLFALRKKIKISSRVMAVIVACLVITAVLSQSVFINDFKITMLDVGQGDCILIRTPEEKTVLIDGGNGKVNVSDCLLAMGIKKLDIVIVTHSDSDHMLGVVDVLKNLAAGMVYVNQSEPPQAFDQLTNDTDITVNTLGQGDTIQLSGLCSMDILNPVKGSKAEGEDINDESVVVRLRYKQFSAIFMGDAGVSVESRLEDMKIGSVNVLKVGHHGSKNSTSDAFLDAISPDIALIGVGKNRYGHPTEEVLEKLKKHNVEIFRTDLEGAITLETDGKNIRVSYMLEPLPCDNFQLSSIAN